MVTFGNQQMYTLKKVVAMDNPIGGPDVRLDKSHTSNHFMEGTHDTPITQKIRADDQTIKLNTPVDGKGNVDQSTFDSFKR